MFCILVTSPPFQDNSDSIPQDQLSQLLKLAASDVAGLSSATAPGPRMRPFGPSVMFDNVRAACASSESRIESVSLPRKLLQVTGRSFSAGVSATQSRLQMHNQQQRSCS